MAEFHTFILILQTFFGVYAYDQLVIPKETVAKLSSTLGAYNASNAVDGSTKQHIPYCSHTADKNDIKEAWLQIDLNKIYSIKTVKFWYRSDQPRTTRLPGYSIRVSNDSALPSPESICYQDPGNAIQMIEIENNCEMTGQFVWIYQNHTYLGKCPILEICEVKVFGCETGRYGEFCNHTCDHCKNNDTCGIASGRCDHSGCAKANFLSPLCTECMPGRFGVDCHNTCSLFCSNKTCNRTTGTCLHGCETGYTGIYCNQTCYFGTYGESCSQICGRCLGNVTCNIVNGTCRKGCEEGYMGNHCYTPCEDGKYGNNCIKNCTGNCLNNEVCDLIDGSCSSCIAGFQGKICDSQCKPGWFGINCSLECGHCLHSSACNRTTGACEEGCDPGWQDSHTCDIACKNGTFGKDCYYNCTKMCANGNFCNKMDGSCSNCPLGSENCQQTIDASIRFDEIAGFISTIVFVGVVVVAVFVTVCRQRLRKQSSGLIDDHIYHLPEFINDENKYEELSTADDTVASHHIQFVEPFCLPSLPKGQTELKKIFQATAQQNDVMQTSVKKLSVIQTSTEQHRELKRPTKTVMIPDLRSRIHGLEEHFNEGFLKEFESISKLNPDKLCSAGKLRENVTKNTCATTLPYDHSRVILQSTVSDYINASFIKNTRDDTSYIASQEPMTNIYFDFWQMVWQEDVHIIAMVSSILDETLKLKEKPKPYWPDMVNATMNQGTFAIQLKSEKTYSHFTVRIFLLTNKKSRDNRQAIHLQFTAWPECGTPDPLDLLVYYRHVSRAMEKHPKNKLLVYCSSGIGPTAVIIALDALYKHGLRTGMVNILDFVNKMREDRMNMIDKLEQYICLYRVLYESFRANCNILNKGQFLTDSTLQNITDEFNILSAIKPNDVSFRRDPNLDKCTEYQNTMMHEEKTNSVQSLEEGHVLQCSAVMLSSFTTRNCIIAGRYPGLGEAVDLIRLLLDNKCTTLVSVNSLTDVPYSKEWFSSSAETHNIQVEVIPVAKMSEHITLSTFRAKESFAHHWHQTTVYELMSWKYSDDTPCDFYPILDVIKSIQLDNRIDIKTKLVVLSRDGATGCGVFCAVYNAIQQLQQDEEVDMFTIVRKLQSRRPEMISDLSEYLYCYNALKHYIKRT